MNTAYTLENEKIVSLTHNGKPVMKSFLNALKKAQETPYWKLFTLPQEGVNRFSGVRVQLDNLEASIYAWCIAWYKRYEEWMRNGCVGKLESPVQTYDDMRYLFLEINSDAYYDLLD